jgi:hypothetical protein
MKAPEFHCRTIQEKAELFEDVLGCYRVFSLQLIKLFDNINKNLRQEVCKLSGNAETRRDYAILRELGKQIAEIAALPA